MLNQYRYRLGKFSITLCTIKISGSDAYSFLQSQCTFDMQSLPSGHFNLTTFLDPQGRIESYGWILREDNDFYYLVPKKLIDGTVERLNRYLVSEDVEIGQGLPEKWTILLGPLAHEISLDTFYQGKIFDEESFLLKGETVLGVDEINEADVEAWRKLSGWPSFSGEDFKKEVINNNRLFDLTVTPNKGCYPGQETVAKISSGRGAAYAPVLIELTNNVSPGEITNFGKKIGSIGSTQLWEGKLFAEASLLRDFRVEGMKLIFELGQETHSGIVRYYPLLAGERHKKAQELYYQGLDYFKDDNFNEAERLLRLAIAIDQEFADAYESLGVLLGRQERFSEAIDIMKQLIEVDPSSVLAHTNMSLFLMRLGKIEEAEEQKSLATVKSFQKFGEEAQLKEQMEKEQKLKQEEWLKRESMFLQVLEIDAEDTLANYGIGSIAVEKGEWEKARNHLEKVLKIDPKYTVAYLALGRAYCALGKKEEARSTWKEGISVAASRGDLMPANQMQSELERL